MSKMSNVTTLQLSSYLSSHRSIAADLIAQSEETRQKAAKYAESFANLESIIGSLNGAKRHGYRIRFRALQSELKAAIDELTILERELVDIRRGLAQQAVATSAASEAHPALAKVAGQQSKGPLEDVAKMDRV
ncbi:hypothetical protein ACNJX9_37695 [Bradyrhizobium sp. DASA03076]|jgi:hypothetical protein|uniref:hypothetical protein n=1 Tax=Bradyrhizobium sp. BLXBL-03 TaxID=3395916 RepID=UPI003F6EDF92